MNAERGSYTDHAFMCMKVKGFVTVNVGVVLRRFHFPDLSTNVPFVFSQLSRALLFGVEDAQQVVLLLGGQCCKFDSSRKTLYSASNQ